MSDSDSSLSGSNGVRAKSYNLMLQEPSSSPRVRNLIQEFAHVDRGTAEEMMRHPPVAILEGRPLQEVVDLRTRLMRLGVNVRIESSVTQVSAEEDLIEVVDEPAGTPAEAAPVPTLGDLPESPILADIPVAPKKSLPLFSSRFWSYLLSLGAVAVILTLIALWMLNSMRRSQTSSDRVAFSRKKVTTVVETGKSPQPRLSRPAPRIDLSRDINQAVRNHDGARAAQILQDCDRLTQVDQLTKALGSLATTVPKSDEMSKDEPSAHETKPGAGSASLSASSDFASIDPAVVSVLRALKDRRSLSQDLDVHWEITGTRLTGWVDLPANTGIEVEVTAPGKSWRNFPTRVSNGRITIPPFSELTAGTIKITTNIGEFRYQPASIQRLFDLDRIPLDFSSGVSAEIKVTDAPDPRAQENLGWAIGQVESQMEINGQVAKATALPIGIVPNDSLLLIRGQSQDVYSFVRSAILAAGLITQSISDPPVWILIEVNNERYWIESYRCRQAIRNYAGLEPALEDYIVNNLITL